MTKLRLSMRRAGFQTAMLFLILSASSASLSAQGLAAIAVPRENGNPEAAYHAKVRDAVTAVLQSWAQSLEQKDSVATARAYTGNAKSHIGELPESSSPLGIVRALF